MATLELFNVTLCAISDVAVDATIASMEKSLRQVRFADAVFLSSKSPILAVGGDLRHETISPIRSREDYSNFVLTRLASHIRTEFALIVQWDSAVVDSDSWEDHFLEFDYIGAPWIDQPIDRSVGNGGFSLRSKRLLEAGALPWFAPSHPEDICIAQRNRDALEKHGFRIADLTTAQRFSRERGMKTCPHFGIHGIFALDQVLSESEFEQHLSSVEFGVMGRRELQDIFSAHRNKHRHFCRSMWRCLFEHLARFPFSRSSYRILKSLVGRKGSATCTVAIDQAARPSA